MSYSTDLSYINYYKNAADGHYDRGFLSDRFTVAAFASTTAAVGIVRELSRLISIVVGVAKISFYTLACLFTFGSMGNAKRLKDHCQLFALNLAGLGAQAIQCVIHTFAIGIGIIAPRAGFRMMQGGSTPLGWVTSKENKIYENYKTPVICQKVTEAPLWILSQIFEKLPLILQLPLITLTNEFSDACKAGLLTPISMSDRFCLFSANPKKLTTEQKSLRPILLLNGNFSHQGTFLPLLYHLQKTGNKRPVFSFNLPPNTIDPSVIKPHIDRIRDLYETPEDEDLVIDAVGHSMGSIAIYALTSKEKEYSIKTGRAITLGTPWCNSNGGKWPLPEGCQTKVFDITGDKDVLITNKSPKGENVDTGHMGLMLHPKSLKAVSKSLNQ